MFLCACYTNQQLLNLLSYICLCIEKHHINLLHIYTSKGYRTVTYFKVRKTYLLCVASDLLLNLSGLEDALSFLKDIKLLKKIFSFYYSGKKLAKQRQKWRIALTFSWADNLLYKYVKSCCMKICIQTLNSLLKNCCTHLDNHYLNRNVVRQSDWCSEVLWQCHQQVKDGNYTFSMNS